ncbi:MAG TPA: nuclear transport factor 2 family protein, partial [Flavisolibacter sp.]|nr:nuclear transport factor 2 family protein [Flavisolibacter sp.]
MKKIFCLCTLITVLFSCKDDADKTKAEYNETATRELTLLNDQYDSALVKSDTGWLNKIYADGFTYTTPEGQIRNKKEQLSNLASGGLKIEFGKSDAVTVQVFDSTAVVAGRFAGKGIFKGSIIDINERYTTVWRKTDGR